MNRNITERVVKLINSGIDLCQKFHMKQLTPAIDITWLRALRSDVLTAAEKAQSLTKPDAEEASRAFSMVCHTPKGTFSIVAHKTDDKRRYIVMIDGVGPFVWKGKTSFTLVEFRDLFYHSLKKIL